MTSKLMDTLHERVGEGFFVYLLRSTFMFKALPNGNFVQLNGSQPRFVLHYDNV
jgi:hypothetical protein